MTLPVEDTDKETYSIIRTLNSSLNSTHRSVSFVVTSRNTTYHDRGDTTGDGWEKDPGKEFRSTTHPLSGVDERRR